MSDRKPWEWTWTAHAGDEHEASIVVTHDATDTIVVEDLRTAELIAAAPDILRALLDVEWISRPDPFGDVCPWCGVERGHDIPPPFRHATDCQRQAVLRKAGVIE